LSNQAYKSTTSKEGKPSRVRSRFNRVSPSDNQTQKERSGGRGAGGQEWGPCERPAKERERDPRGLRVKRALLWETMEPDALGEEKKKKNAAKDFKTLSFHTSRKESTLTEASPGSAGWRGAIRTKEPKAKHRTANS